MTPITLNELKPYLFKNELQKTLIVDVRTPEEYLEKRLQGTINIPLNILPEKIKHLPKKGCLILHCAHGFRAKKGTEFLSSHGFESVFYVKGDIENWENDELPVIYGDDD